MQIVGIVLVRNEDLYVERAVRNVAEFCDRLILCDHKSQDETPAILLKLSREFPHSEFHALTHPRESHDLIKRFAGTNAWVFGVDGDEIYDPQGLKIFRRRVLSGEFDSVWRMKGNALHCAKLDMQGQTATGYLAPPSRSITKFYNFSAIESWDGDITERLHGGTIRFRANFRDDHKRNLQDELAWDVSPLRCLHLCFLRRSSRDAELPGVRQNIVELYQGGVRGGLMRLANRVLGRNDSRWKREHYQRGPMTRVGTAPFFS